MFNSPAPALDRFSPPAGVLAVPEDYPLVNVVKETITGKWSGAGDQVRLHLAMIELPQAHYLPDVVSLNQQIKFLH